MVPTKSWKVSPLLADNFPQFSHQATVVIQGLISPTTTIILTTSHKGRFTNDEWQRIFLTRGIDVQKLETLVTNQSHLNRKDEILHWFNLNDSPKDFIIIDDDTSLYDLPPELKNKLVMTNSMIGLTDQHLPEIKRIISLIK